MVPVLFHVGVLPVRTHEFFTLLGLAVGSGVLVIEARRRGMLDARLPWLVLGALLGGGIGARLGTLGRYLADAPDPSVSGALLEGGKTILGGLAGAYVGVLIAKRILGYREHTGDAFAPAVAIAVAIGRVGCLLTEQVGTPTSLPWGIAVSPAVAARIPMCPTCSAGELMHPSFLYEIAFHLVMFFLLYTWLRSRAKVSGDLFTFYLVAYAAFRFGVEFVRGNDVLFGGLTGPQVFLLITAPLLVLRFVSGRRRLPGSVPAPDPDGPVRLPGRGPCHPGPRWVHPRHAPAGVAQQGLLEGLHLWAADRGRPGGSGDRRPDRLHAGHVLRRVHVELTTRERDASDRDPDRR